MYSKIHVSKNLCSRSPSVLKDAFKFVLTHPPGGSGAAIFLRGSLILCRFRPRIWGANNFVFDLRYSRVGGWGGQPSCLTFRLIFVFLCSGTSFLGLGGRFRTPGRGFRGDCGPPKQNKKMIIFIRAQRAPTPLYLDARPAAAADCAGSRAAGSLARTLGGSVSNSGPGTGLQ